LFINIIQNIQGSENQGNSKRVWCLW